MDANSPWQTISAEHLKQELDNGAGFLLVDVLPGEVFAMRHLPGAVNACVFEVTFPDQIARITRDQEAPLVIYGFDHATLDAADAADKLVRDGYRRVTVLAGGLKAWQEMGYGLEGANPEQADELDAWLPLEDGSYQAVTQECFVGWTGRNPNKRHYGRVDLAEGRLELKDRQARGRFEIDLTTIMNIDLTGDEWQPVLLKHLASSDFFWVTRFPGAVFNLTSALPRACPGKSSPNFEILGELELKGLKAPLGFQATANPGPEGRIIVEAHFDIDRTKWGVRYGSSRFFRHLSYHLVHDLISLELKIVLISVCPQMRIFFQDRGGR